MRVPDKVPVGSDKCSNCFSYVTLGGGDLFRGESPSTVNGEWKERVIRVDCDARAVKRVDIVRRRRAGDIIVRWR